MMRTALSRRISPFLVLLATAVLGACDQDPVSVDGVALMKRGGGGSKVSVVATDPSAGDAGAVAIDVRVFGSGFDDGSKVEFLIDRSAEAIQTNSTSFVDETELVANITIDPEAFSDQYDVEVQTRRGRKGIGIELFEVFGKQQCQVEFDLDLVDGPVGSDLGGTYESGTQKVLVFTGSSGDGFRFDTNGSQQLEGRKDKRHIWLDFRGTAWTHLAGVGEDKGVDFRFAAGLDLCAMTIDESATVPVPVNLPFLSSFDGETIGLKYGGVTWSGNACNTPEASVTRTAQNQWQVSGGEACVVREGEILNPSPVVMPFSFTLTAQGTVP